MNSDTRTARWAATTTGALILGASAYAVIHSAQQTLPHAILTGALAAGVLAGAATIGRAWASKRHGLALAIGIGLLAGEAFNLAATADRIVSEREAGQAAVRAKQGGHDYALKELTRTREALATANDAARTKAAEKGCKENCRALLQAQVDNAKAAHERAETVYAANPAPTASASALADRLGVGAWVIDLAIAAMLSIGANGLAAALIAYGAHGNRRQEPAVSGAGCTVAQYLVQAGSSSATGGSVQPADPVHPMPPKGGSRRPVAVMPVATKAAAEVDVIRLVARGDDIPSQDVLARRWNVHKSTASRWVRDFEQRGLIVRRWDGRHNAVRALASA